MAFHHHRVTSTAARPAELAISAARDRPFFAARPNMASHTLELVRPAIAAADGVSIVPYVDNTQIWVGTLIDPGTLQTVLDIGDRWTGTLATGACIWTNNKRISGSGEQGAGNGDTTLIPTYAQASTLMGERSRYNGVAISLFPLGDGTATITLDGVTVVASLPLTAGTVASHNTGSVSASEYTGTWQVTADVPVIGCISDHDLNGDNQALLAPATELLTWASNSAYAGGAPGTTGTYAPAGGATHTEALGAAGYAQISRQNLGVATSSYCHPDAAIHALMNPAGCISQRGDSDGGNATAGFPLDLVKQIHVIPQPTEYIAMCSTSPAVVTVIDDTTGLVLDTVILTRTNTDTNAPYSARLGGNTASVNYQPNTRLHSTHPIHVVYQTKGAGSFGADDDEIASFGWNPEDLL